MRKLTLALSPAVFVCAASILHAATPVKQRNVDTFWPQFRGPVGTGVAPKADPPTTWSEEENVRWKMELPGSGHATPVIWDDRIYLLAAVATKTDEPAEEPEEEEQAGEGRRGRRMRTPAPKHAFQFQVLCLDRKSGKTIWTTTVSEEIPHEGGHPDASQASNSPVTDGKHIYAHFGSRGLYCLDMKGKVKWKKRFGKMTTRNEFGEGSSPALHGDALVINWDHEGEDFVAAFNKKTGKQLWKVERDEPTNWSTPLVVEAGKKPQVIVSATNFIRAYDLKTGKEVWRCSGMTANTIPTPVAGRGLVYCLSGFRGNALLAIRYGAARGDISESSTISWKYDKHTPYVPSPLLYHDCIYFLDNNRPILSCLDARSGDENYVQQRLDGLDMIYASIVGASNRVYIVGRNGKTMVLKHGSQFEVLATNSLDDGFDASPAIAGDELFLRGRKHLYCIAAE